MFGKTALSLAICTMTATAMAPASLAQGRQSHTVNLRANVPVNCSVRFDAVSAFVESASGIGLGSFREYCNSPRGYELVVSYSPGSLRGAELIAGADRVVLDGSGRAVLSRSVGPRLRERQLTIAPGVDGFDSTRLELDILPM